MHFVFIISKEKINIKDYKHLNPFKIRSLVFFLFGILFLLGKKIRFWTSWHGNCSLKAPIGKMHIYLIANFPLALG